MVTLEWKSKLITCIGYFAVRHVFPGAASGAALLPRLAAGFGLRTSLGDLVEDIDGQFLLGQQAFEAGIPWANSAGGVVPGCGPGTGVRLKHSKIKEPEVVLLFIGQTRFSLFNPDSPAWRASNNSRFNTVDEYKDYLYSDDRLGARCEIFLDHSMPQLAMAADVQDVDLVHVVSYSDSLPEKYKSILAEGAERFPFLLLEERAQGRKIITIEDIARDRMSGTGAFAVFRLDDDDLLPMDYFDQVKPYVKPANVGMQVSLPIGATALYQDGDYNNVRKAYWPMLAIGLLDVCVLNADGSIDKPLPAPHHMSDRTNPVIVDGRGLGWMWVRHASQDTSLDFGGEANPATLSKVVAHMNKYPEFTDARALSDAFPVVKERIRPGTL